MSEPVLPPQKPNEPQLPPWVYQPSAGKADLLVMGRKFWNETYLPKSDHYRLLTKAVATVFAVAVLPTYYLAVDNPILRPAVYWPWRTSVFGFWNNSLPYFCRSGFCDANTYGEANWLLAILFVVAGLISIRLLLVCLEMLETALNTNLVERLLHKWLPEKEKNVGSPAAPVPAEVARPSASSGDAGPPSSSER